MAVRANAATTASDDSLFFYPVEDPRRGEVLGGIEWVGVGNQHPDELPSPELLDLQPARIADSATASPPGQSQVTPWAASLRGCWRLADPT